MTTTNERLSRPDAGSRRGVGILSERLFRTWWRALRFFGLAKLSWDQQYQAGVWDRGPRSRHTVDLVSTLCAGGRLVEFGCGEGALPHLLPQGCYSEYVGFDISAIAIERARQRACASGRRGLRFQQMDMAEWRAATGISLIVAEECLYYLNAPRTEQFLSECTRSLTPNGHVLVVVHSARRHARTLDICRRCCDVVSERTQGSRVYLLLRRARGAS
jgi:SAM-dependent methyltransferase